jgi:hypothetical protein
VRHGRSIADDRTGRRAIQLHGGGIPPQDPAQQIDPIFVLKDGRSYRIRPELFALPTPANVIPFARAFDEEKLGKVIAENLASSSEFASTMMAAMMRQFLRDTTVRSA